MADQQNSRMVFEFGATVVAPLLCGIASYMGSRLKQRLKPPPKAIDLSAMSQVDHRVHETLTELRLTVGAVRTYVSKYHNGEYFIDQSELVRKTRTHEVVADGWSYQSEHFRNILLSSLSEETALVLARGPSFTPVSKIPPSRFKALCEMGNIKSVARIALMYGQNVRGIVGCDFDTEVEPANIELMQKYASRIEALFQEAATYRKVK